MSFSYVRLTLQSCLDSLQISIQLSPILFWQLLSPYAHNDALNSEDCWTVGNCEK